MLCPVCNSETQRLFTSHDYWIRGCTICHHRCTEVAATEAHTKRIYGDDYFHGGGAGYPDYLAEAPVIRTHAEWYVRLLKRYMPPGKMLDIGAAAGFVLRTFLDNGWKGNGIEPNPGMADYACNHLGLQVNTGSIESIQCDVRYDLLAMIQVVAHFYDLRTAFQKAAQMTRPAGFWLIETWNRESWTARAFGKYWHEYSPPSVLHWFSPEDLKRLAAQFGFEEIARGKPPKWIGCAHAKSLMKHKLRGLKVGRLTDKLLGVVPDRLAVPYPGDDLFWMLFQSTASPSSCES